MRVSVVPRLRWLLPTIVVVALITGLLGVSEPTDAATAASEIGRARLEQGLAFQIQDLTTGVSLATGDGGGGAGVATFEAVKMLKRMDGSTPLLYQAAHTGKNFAEVTIVIYKPGSTQSLVSYELTDAFVSAYSANAKKRRESISMKFKQIRISTASNTTCWNIQNATAC